MRSRVSTRPQAEPGRTVPPSPCASSGPSPLLSGRRTARVGQRPRGRGGSRRCRSGASSRPQDQAAWGWGTAQLRGFVPFPPQKGGRAAGPTDILFRELGCSLRAWASGGRSRAARPTGTGALAWLAPAWRSDAPLSAPTGRRAAGRQRPSAGCLFGNRGLFYCPRNTGRPAYQSGRVYFGPPLAPTLKGALGRRLDCWATADREHLPPPPGRWAPRIPARPLGSGHRGTIEECRGRPHSLAPGETGTRTSAGLS